MSFRFSHIKGINITLFALHSMGKVAEPSRLFLLFYLADLKHLANYGTLITGDRYVAMKYGPAPSQILAICQQIKSDTEANENKFKKMSPLAINEQHQIVARDTYNIKYLQATEVECIFEILHLYKNASQEMLSHITMGKAWANADINGEISIAEMAMESSATPAMLARIERNCTEEMLAFK